MTTGMRVLYREKAEQDRRNQLVEVEIRKWYDSGICDVVIEKRIIVDGKDTLHTRGIMDRQKQDAGYIRRGIAVFDQLRASHPALAVK